MTSCPAIDDTCTLVGQGLVKPYRHLVPNAHIQDILDTNLSHVVPKQDIQMPTDNGNGSVKLALPLVTLQTLVALGLD